MWSSSISLRYSQNTFPPSLSILHPPNLLERTGKRPQKLKTDLSNQPNAESEFKPPEGGIKKKHAIYFFLKT